MDREKAFEFLYRNLQNENLRKHSLAVGAVMEALAKHFNEDGEKWFVTGLLHDIDYEFTMDDPDSHSVMGAEMLEKEGLPGDVVHAVKAHADHAPLESLLDKSLYAADPITGLITAAALMQPERTIAEVKLKSLKKKYKSKSFAAGANREQIATCSDIGFELADFLQLSIDAMTKYDQEIMG